MPTLKKQKQIRIEKLVILVFLTLSAVLLLVALRDFANRTLMSMLTPESVVVPIALYAVPPVYFALCLVLGYFTGKYAAIIWHSPYTPEEIAKG